MRSFTRSYLHLSKRMISDQMTAVKEMAIPRGERGIWGEFAAQRQRRASGDMPDARLLTYLCHGHNTSLFMSEMKCAILILSKAESASQEGLVYEDGTESAYAFG